MPNLIRTLEQAGFRGKALQQAWAIAMRESGGNPGAFNGNASTGDKSYGLFQVNMLGSLGPARLKQYGLTSEKQLLNPAVNARVAYQMSHGGKDFGAWGIGPNAYKGAPPAAYQRYQQLLGQFPGPKGGGPNLPLGQGPRLGRGGPGTSQVNPAAALMLAQATAAQMQAGTQAVQSDISGQFGQAGSDLASMAQQRGALMNAMALGLSSQSQGAAQHLLGAPGLAGMIGGKGTPKGQAIARLAQHFNGTPYVWGGSSPGGFDCSGLASYVYGKFGIRIPRTTYDQWKAGQPVGRHQLDSGDLVYYKGSDAKVENGQLLPGHVGIYLGNGKIINAYGTGYGTRVQNVNDPSLGGYMGARSFGNA